MSSNGSRLKAAVLIVSDTASKDPTTDRCIPVLKEIFANVGNDQWEVSTTDIVSDDVITIQKAIKALTDCADPVNLLVTSGGTGFALRDVTPEVAAPC
jgi:gephyrin